MDLLFYFLLFLFGTFIGSFLGVIIYRLPLGESIVRGRSHCDHCKRTLTAIDLVPIFSFLFLQGKCRHCGKKLSWFYPILEITTGILFVFAAFFVGSMYQLFSMQYTIELVYYWFIISSLITLFFIDFKYGILPFSIILVGVIAVVGHILLSTPSLLSNFLLSAIGAFLFFLSLFLATRGRGMGFGDVVYVFYMGLLLGFPQIVLGLYISFVSGAVISLVLIGLKLKKMKGGIIPFGPFLVFGTIVALFWGKEITDFVMTYLTN